jgi:phage recombination protein Bet
MKTKAVVQTKADRTPLSIEIIKQYICPKATDTEAFMFLELCKAQGLNPFLKEAYLIKYKDGEPASMVVGKDTFTKRASHLKEFDGFKAGIIILNNAKEVEYREGAFTVDGEELLGGWAEVYRKDRTQPFRNEVSVKDYAGKKGDGELNRQWSSKAATMIRKTALVQSLREAFPDDLGAMYSPEEFGIDPAELPTYKVGQAPAIPAPIISPKKKDPKSEKEKSADLKDSNEPSTDAQVKAIGDMLTRLKITDDLERCKKVSSLAGIDDVVTDISKLTYNQAVTVIAALAKIGTR